MEDGGKDMDQEIKEFLLGAAKRVSFWGAVLAVVFIFGPERLFRFFGQTFGLIGLVIKRDWRALKRHWHNLSGKSAPLVIRQWQKFKLCAWGISAVSVLAAISGFLYQEGWLIALAGMIFGTYLLAVWFLAQIVTDIVVKIVELAEKGAETGCEALISFLNKTGLLEINESGQFRVLDAEAFKNRVSSARSLIIPCLAFSFYCALFPYWSTLATVPVIGVAILAIVVMAAEWNYCTKSGQRIVYRLTYAALIVFVLALGIRVIFPQSTNAALELQGKTDIKVADWLKDPGLPKAFGQSGSKPSVSQKPNKKAPEHEREFKRLTKELEEEQRALREKYPQLLSE